MPEDTGSPVQQQGTCPATPLNLGVQRKVTMTGQHEQGPSGTLQASRGGMGNAHQNRVCCKWTQAFFCAVDTNNNLEPIIQILIEPTVG